MAEPPERGPRPERTAAQTAADRARDEVLAASPHRDRAPVWPAALAGAVVWLAAEGGLVWAARLLPEGIRPASLAEAATLAFCVTAPVALAAAWGGLAARASAADLRLDAIGRAASRAALGGGGGRGGAVMAEGLSRADLTHAVAHAARDALDRERGAIARQLAELGETQRRIDLAIGRMVAEHSDAIAPAAPPEITALTADPAVAELAELDAPAAAAPARQPAPAARQPATIPASPPRPPATPDAQPSLPLADTQDKPPAPGARDWSVLARALDFPKDERDEAGFAALEIATRDRPMAELLQAAEDALTILAQHGIYMEDLEVRHAPPALWLRFARGERGVDLTSVGGVTSETMVDTVRRMMKADPVFRDTVMHLMRRFDSVLRLAAAEPRGEGRLVDLADSRTGRAFMLVAQAVGAFD